jgi:ribosomal-protein-alanine N-acetyltransferase
MAAKIKTPLLTTERLLLLVPGPKDARRMLWYVLENRDHLAPWEPVRFQAYFTEEFWRQELAAAQREYLEGLSLRLVLVESGDPGGPIVGTANFRNIVRGVFQACHLGYSLDHRFQGRGLMQEALTAAIAHVFEELGLHRVMANYMPHNERSARLLQRLGFTVEGQAKSYLFLDGAWRDHVLTSLVNPKEI